MKLRDRTLGPGSWGLSIGAGGELTVGGCSSVELARDYGTPLHVIDSARLETTARAFLRAFSQAYPGSVSVHYAFKCNGVPGVIGLLRRAGLKAEVMNPFELDLARRLGFQPDDIIVNGPAKDAALLRACADAGVRFVVVDSLPELDALDRLGRERGRSVDVLLRINPDYTPRGMNQGSATASRKGCAFGIDLVGGEAGVALDKISHATGVNWQGFHIHIGTGIRIAEDYRRALLRLRPLVEEVRRRGLAVRVVDVGGGFAAGTSREMTQAELLVYQGTGRLPAGPDPTRCPTFEDFAAEVARGIEGAFGDDHPELLFEPGRSIASSCQLLLLSVIAVKERPGVRKWVITDGGLGTVTMPTFYEYHEVLLGNDPLRPRTERVTITGPVCFSNDVVYHNKPMPRVEVGEVLAVMDSGAYFTALESSFGFPRPAVVAARDGQAVLLRRRETFEDMTARDRFPEIDGGPRPDRQDNNTGR